MQRMIEYSKTIILFVMIALPLYILPPPVLAQFSFAVVSDQRQFSGPGSYNTPNYFLGAMLALNELGAGAFIVSPGDIDPPEDSMWTIQHVFGGDYQWYPVVGNHELPDKGSESHTGYNLEWLRNYNYDINGKGILPDLINNGPLGCPDTTFSFDYENVHFVVLNEYCDFNGDSATDGDIPDHLYDWLLKDLSDTQRQHIFVFGHEPAFPQPDADNGRERHFTDSLNAHETNRDRFWSLLQQTGVVAYFCGHTHNFSAVNIHGVWQIDTGHARGQADLGAPSTFLKVYVSGARVTYSAHRDIHNGLYDYTDIVHQETLKGFPWTIFLPAITNIKHP